MADPDNPPVDFSPFVNLKSTGSLQFVNYRVEEVVVFFPSLTHILSVGGLRIQSTDFKNLDFLKTLEYIDGQAKVSVGDQITDISGLRDITYGPNAIRLVLINNPKLAVCHYDFVCEFLTEHPVTSGVYGNLAGCNSQDTVLIQCANGPPPRDDDPTLCPMASRPGMQVINQGSGLYGIIHMYGQSRAYMSDLTFDEVANLIYHHKFEKDLLFDFEQFDFQRYCALAKEICEGKHYEVRYDDTDPWHIMQYHRVMQEIEYFKDMSYFIKAEECIKL